MIPLDGGLIYNVIVVAVTFLAGLVVYYKWSFSYWKRIGLEYLEPSIPFGNTLELFRATLSFGQQFEKFYKQLRIRRLRHGGVYMFTRPVYVPTDPEIIKDMMVKNFNHFVDRGFYVNEEVDPLSGHLFSLEGEKWKNLRIKLTQTFTSGKMKMMFKTMADCADELKVLINKVSTTKEDVDIKEILARFTTDVISSCAFGLESNSLKNPDTEFRYYGKRQIENSTWQNIKNLIQLMCPRRILSAIKFRTVKQDVESFILNVVQKNVNYREENNIHRNDFFHLLLQLKNLGKITDDVVVDSTAKNKESTLTINELAAQVFLFFIAGYETSSITMTFILYELALNQKIQDKLRKEINTVLETHKNQVSYDAIMEMTYMDQVINEALRKHATVSFLNRQCTIPYKVPDSNVQLEKGTMVVIPTMALQNDPEYYPNPDLFDPDRFSEANKSTRPAFTWMPFGEGPRVCIGVRFAMLQIKIGLTTLLSNHKVTPSPKSSPKIDKKTFITTNVTGIYLNFTKCDDI